MSKIIVSEFVTVDGVMESPGEKGSLGGRGGWTWACHNEAIEAFKNDELFSCDTLLLGRVTYDGFSKAWPTMKDTGAFGERMNTLPKYVVSSTLKTVDWNNSRIIHGHIVDEIAELKRQPGKDILVFGSADLVQLLLEHSLVDEFKLLVYPVVLGVGKKLFQANDESHTLTLLETKTYESGVVLLRYAVNHGEKRGA